MLARSLIRDVAPAGIADDVSSSNAQAAPHTLADKTLGILCSPLRSWLDRRITPTTAIRHDPCERRAIPFLEIKILILLSKIMKTDLRSGPAPRRNCPWRQVLPGRLRAINHKRAKLGVTPARMGEANS